MATRPTVAGPRAVRSDMRLPSPEVTGDISPTVHRLNALPSLIVCGRRKSLDPGHAAPAKELPRRDFVLVLSKRAASTRRPIFLAPVLLVIDGDSAACSARPRAQRARDALSVTPARVASRDGPIRAGAQPNICETLRRSFR